MSLTRRALVRHGAALIATGALAFGPGTGETEPKGSFDVVGKNFHDSAGKLGV